MTTPVVICAEMGHAFSAAKLLATKIDQFMDLEIKPLEETPLVDPLDEVLEALPFEYAVAMAQECGVTSRVIGAREGFTIAGIDAEIEALVERPCGKRQRRLLVVFSAPEHPVRSNRLDLDEMVRQWSRRRVLEVEAGGTRHPLTRTYRKSWRQNARERLQGPTLGKEGPEFVERPAILSIGGQETHDEVALQLMIFLAQWKLAKPDSEDMQTLKRYLKGLFRRSRFREAVDDEVAGAVLMTFTHPERPLDFRHYCKQTVKAIYYQRLREQHSNTVEFRESSPATQHPSARIDHRGRPSRKSLKDPSDPSLDGYSAHALAQRSGLKLRTIYELMHDGKLPAAKRGVSLRVNKEVAERFLDEQRTKTQIRNLSAKLVSDGLFTKDAIRKQIYRWRKAGISDREIVSRLNNL